MAEGVCVTALVRVPAFFAGVLRVAALSAGRGDLARLVLVPGGGDALCVGVAAGFAGIGSFSVDKAFRLLRDLDFIIVRMGAVVFQAFDVGILIGIAAAGAGVLGVAPGVIGRLYDLVPIIMPGRGHAFFISIPARAGIAIQAVLEAGRLDDHLDRIVMHMRAGSTPPRKIRPPPRSAPRRPSPGNRQN